MRFPNMHATADVDVSENWTRAKKSVLKERRKVKMNATELKRWVLEETSQAGAVGPCGVLANDPYTVTVNGEATFGSKKEELSSTEMKKNTSVTATSSTKTSKKKKKNKNKTNSTTKDTKKTLRKMLKKMLRKMLHLRPRFLKRIRN